MEGCERERWKAGGTLELWKEGETQCRASQHPMRQYDDATKRQTDKTPKRQSTNCGHHGRVTRGQREREHTVSLRVYNMSP